MYGSSVSSLSSSSSESGVRSGIFHINIGGGHGACKASTNTCSLSKACLSLLIDFVLTGVALIWAVAHLDFCGLPVNFGVVFAKPGEAEDDVLPP
jgi:hypothetical protein